MDKKLIRKLFRDPVLFARDALIKRKPLVLNEIDIPINEQSTVIKVLDNLEQKIENEIEVDVVYTWVNHNDETWKRKKDEAAELFVNKGLYANDLARFESHDELKFSVASVKKFMPWVRKIFIVTDKQMPPWFVGDPDVKIVDHSELIGRENLPTFNSHVIEANLHRIEGLSEHFIYFNDDVFVSRALSKNHFFQSNGLAALFLSNKSLNVMASSGVKTPTLRASIYSSQLIYEHYGVKIDTPLIHTYIPLRKSVCESVEKEFNDEIKAFLPNKFRADGDINFLTFLVPWISYLKNMAFCSVDISYYFNIRSKASNLYWDALMSSKFQPHSFCANDFYAESN